MILQQIVDALDSELERMRQLRAIVSGLEGGIPVVDQGLNEAAPPERGEEPSGATAMQAAETGEARVAVVRGRASRKGQRGSVLARPRVPKGKLVEKLQTALTGTIPTGPVVVRREALRSSAPALPAAPRPEPGSLGSMIRALHLDATA